MKTLNNLNHGQLRSKLDVGVQYFYFKFKHYNPVHIQITRRTQPVIIVAFHFHTSDTESKIM